MAPEVLIYISGIKKFLSTNEEARNYFLNDLNEDDFYAKVAKSSQKNFEKTGDPMLHKNQFEEIKSELKSTPTEKNEKNIFLDLKDFGTICLN